MPPAMRSLTLHAFLVACTFGLAGCDMLGIESASVLAAKREAEGKAIGAGCRHAARSVEQCYALNKRADKASVFAGWREMNDYMRENKLEAMPARDESATELAAAADHGEAPAEVVAAQADKPAKGAKTAAPATAKH